MLLTTQRFEKLCRSILGSMDVENEPKVSMIIMKESSGRTVFLINPECDWLWLDI